LNKPGERVLYLDDYNPFWDCELPWHQVPRAEQKCRRCYSSNHIKKDCKVPHETLCSYCKAGNHHSVVCMRRHAGRPVAPNQKEKKDPETNRQAVAAELVRASIAETDEQDLAQIQAQEQRIQDLIQQVTERLVEPKEKSDREKLFDEINTMIKPDEENFRNMLREAREYGQMDDLIFILLKLKEKRTQVKTNRDFSVFELTAGIQVVPLKQSQKLVRLLAICLYLTITTGLILFFSGATVRCTDAHQFYHEDRICKSTHPGFPFQRALLIFFNFLLLLITVYRRGVNRIFEFGEILVRHNFNFLELTDVELLNYNTNHRHPLMRYGKTLEPVLPMRITHTVDFFVPGRRPLSWHPNILAVALDWITWKILETQKPIFQMFHEAWTPVKPHALRGIVNAHHTFSKFPNLHTSEMGMFFQNLGPNVNQVIVDCTRYDAFSTLPNISAAKDWEAMARNVEVALKTCNWTAENWRAFGPEMSSALSNLLAYRWLAVTQFARRTYRADVDWAF
jgi:hypothetical protein